MRFSPVAKWESLRASSRIMSHKEPPLTSIAKYRVQLYILLTGYSFHYLAWSHKYQRSGLKVLFGRDGWKMPNLVLIAGSWHQGKCYEGITKPLQEQHDLKCITVTLPSTLGDPNSTFKDDIEVARHAIVAEISPGQDVVVFARSFGGMVGSSAIKCLTSSENEDPDTRSTDSRVSGLIFIASDFTLTGLTFLDPIFGIPFVTSL